MCLVLEHKWQAFRQAKQHKDAIFLQGMQAFLLFIRQKAMHAGGSCWNSWRWSASRACHGEIKGSLKREYHLCTRVTYPYFSFLMLITVSAHTIKYMHCDNCTVYNTGTCIAYICGKLPTVHVHLPNCLMYYYFSF